MTLPTILITGGTGKFGRQYVEHFGREGWRVVFTSTSNERARSLINSLPEGLDITAIECDFAQPDSVSSLVETLRSKNATIHHLVNNARSLQFLKIDEHGVTARSDFMSEYLMDVVIPYELAMQLWKSQPDGLQTVVNISSQYGVVATNPELYTDHAHQAPIQYGVAKAALNHLTKELAVRMAPDGIRVNAVAYGGVVGRVDDAFKARYARLSPSGRMLEESEIPGPVDFLVSSKSSAMTGQIIQADGGWTAW